MAPSLRMFCVGGTLQAIKEDILSLSPDPMLRKYQQPRHHGGGGGGQYKDECSNVVFYLL